MYKFSIHYKVFKTFILFDTIYWCCPIVQNDSIYYIFSLVIEKLTLELEGIKKSTKYKLGLVFYLCFSGNFGVLCNE